MLSVSYTHLDVYKRQHLSGAIVIAGIGVSVMIAGGTPIKPVLIGALILLPIGLIGVRALSGVRWARVTSFMNPFADIRDESYQVVQGLYAIGSGGIFGLGLGPVSYTHLDVYKRQS